jgi:hypothetical protein
VIFNFAYANLPIEELRGLPDLVQPVVDGLVENGHHVMRFSPGVRPPPVVNIFIEEFGDDRFVEDLLRMRAEHGVVFGILCAEDIEDGTVMAAESTPRRGANLRRLLAAADFVWTVVPQVAALEAAGAAGKTALLRFGFSERALNPYLVSEPRLRGLDVVLYGGESPYRLGLIAELERRSIGCLRTGRLVFPSYLTADLLSRAKVVLDLGRRPGRRFESPTRLSRALHNGAVVVSEQLSGGSAPDLQRYAAPCAYEAMADQCQRIIQSGIFAELGLAALAKFRQETSMRDNMAAALRLPVFERLARI